MLVGMLNHGVDMNGWPGGLISSAHGEADLTQTIEAFRTTLRDLRAEGDLEGWV